LNEAAFLFRVEVEEGEGLFATTLFGRVCARFGMTTFLGVGATLPVVESTREAIVGTF